jgi:hypothetical protein
MDRRKARLRGMSSDSADAKRPSAVASHKRWLDAATSSVSAARRQRLPVPAFIARRREVVSGEDPGRSSEVRAEDASAAWLPRPDLRRSVGRNDHDFAPATSATRFSPQNATSAICPAAKVCVPSGPVQAMDSSVAHARRVALFETASLRTEKAEPTSCLSSGRQLEQDQVRLF